MFEAILFLLLAPVEDPPRTGAPPPPPAERVVLGGTADLTALAAPGDVLTKATFDAGDEGFRKDFDCSPSVTWNPSGYIESGDECFNNPPPPPGAGCVYWFFEAPGTFVSPASTGAFGGALSYDLKMSTSSGSFGGNAFDVAIFGGDFTSGFHWITRYGVANQLHTDFRHYQVPLDASTGWAEWGNPGNPIPPDVVEVVLSNINRVLIRGAYKLQCEIGNGASVDNVQITAGGAAVGELEIDWSTPELLPREDTGWYDQNPVTVMATLTCPAGGPDCPNPFTLSIESPDAGRFYYLDHDLGAADIPVECEESVTGSDYSHGSLLGGCIRVGALNALTLFAGETKILKWRVWVQPSSAASLAVTAAWGGAPVTKVLNVQPARIHPVVFLHGILGSQPPGGSVIESWPQQGDVIDFSLGPHLDPFIGSYKPLIDNLLRMGYEVGRSIFPVTYEWRQSNLNSAAWLRHVLNTRVGAYGVSTLPPDVGYAAHDGKADVIVHSMGGLVLRSYVAGLATEKDPLETEPLDYQDNVRNAVFIATPHRGFPFDYETLHGMTWKEYTDDQVPGVLGGLIAGTLAFSTDAVLWPYLIMCRYDAGPGEPCNDPATDLLACNTIHAQALYDYSRSNPFDPAHPGIGSLREMIPEKRERAFLSPKSGTIPPMPYLCEAGNSGCVERFGRDENFLLDRLGLNSGRARRSLKRLGEDPAAFDGIYVLYNRDFDTVRRYRVTRPDPLPPKGLPLFPNYQPRFRRWHRGGEPDSRGGRESLNGDGLIPHWSTRLFYADGLLAGQLTARERRNQELHIDDADHVMIMVTRQTQSVVGAILTGLVEPSAARDNPSLFPLYSPYVAPVQILDNLDVLLSFLVQCPASPALP